MGELFDVKIKATGLNGRHRESLEKQEVSNLIADFANAMKSQHQMILSLEITPSKRFWSVNVRGTIGDRIDVWAATEDEARAKALERARHDHPSTSWEVEGIEP